MVPIPGPSSVIAALSATGAPADSFYFVGFLPRRPGRADRVLREALRLGKTVVVLESPYRAARTMEWIADIEPEARVTLAREITKMYEEFSQGGARELAQAQRGKELKGEVVLIIEPFRAQKEIGD